ncbi:hypothetical protein [Salinisphaera sp.]|uniref:hypothetical protein n=1 Tax=Salinisphaera sp. TaxID=1914330 RepID=UPI002D794F01|nr:hypothetical protein [Salinisphaera sp.]HET7314148.1 hypothetical protein [Salinisphaera sp.]
MRYLWRAAGAAAVLGLATVAGVASADTTLTYVGASGQYKVYITPDAVRIDGDGSGWQLYKKDDPAIFSVSPSDRTYTRLDKDTAGEIRHQLDALRARIENRLQQIPADRRPAARAAMAEKIPALDGGSQSVGLDHTGATDTVDGISCNVIQIVRDGRPANKMCVAEAGALGISDDSFDTVKSMFALLHDMLESTGLEGIGLPYRDLSGMPVRFVDSVSGERRELAAVSHDPIADRRFAIPDSYVEQKLQTPSPGG